MINKSDKLSINKEQLYNLFDGRCAYCGKELEPNRWHIDLMDPPKGEFQEDYLPACPLCSFHKHGLGINEFRAKIKSYLERTTVYYSFLKKFGLVQETGCEVVFYFEKVKK